MVSRRQFLQHLGFGMAAATMGLPPTTRPLFGSPDQDSVGKAVRVALLADSHLPDADPETIAAVNLSAAVAEINAHKPPIDLVFLAGDLTDHGDPGALWLGREILSSLSAPAWLLPGEQDGPATATRFWQDTFGGGAFSFSHAGVYFCGFNTTRFNPATGSSYFHFRPEHYRWLARELAPLAPEVPLIILSHAPLYRLFQPWQWWTKDVESLYELLNPRKNVYLFHGHVHNPVALQHRNLTFQGLRATSWPLPDVRVGCTAALPVPHRIGTRTGCGWILLTLNGNAAVNLTDQVWEI
jgi:3',5'-cyclic AMP phosphodiesterase CpdA